MAEVTLKIAGRSYPLACRDGEEAHLRSLGELVDRKAQDAARAMGNMTENRQLLVVALLLADSINEASQGTPPHTATPGATAASGDEENAEAIERLAARLEKLATALETGGVNA